MVSVIMILINVISLFSQPLDSIKGMADTECYYSTKFKKQIIQESELWDKEKARTQIPNM